MGLLAMLTGRSGTRDESTNKPANAARYRGVQVVTRSDGCCQAVRTIEGMRFLADEVPRLPLDQCDSASCHCSFELFDDRRTDLRRTSDIGYDLASELRTSENRRGVPGGRRRSDH